ncbi:hypothetical protein GDO78_021082 [Eleutherodactylus coqui]|uniref:Uncharacterized protein n=1 Tax=Eleutherodactylus coqui TaxID=57060 RepID=A0A8J6EHN9_ELECQ|nr:hypothetical protein GDO78_021082 [Eleutherodactylus coqui]
MSPGIELTTRSAGGMSPTNQYGHRSFWTFQSPLLATLLGDGSHPVCAVLSHSGKPRKTDRTWRTKPCRSCEDITHTISRRSGGLTGHWDIH